jgi:hypothetical protein
MKTEYAVEIYNKYHNFIEQIGVFPTYEEAEEFVAKRNFDLDESSEYVEITEIEYDDNNNEISIEFRKEV